MSLMTADTYRGHEIRLSESGYSYECPDLELSAPTRLELEAKVRAVGGEKSIPCPHCGQLMDGASPNRYCLNCYWQEETP